MPNIVRFRVMLQEWHGVYETSDYDPELQVARRIIQRFGLGDPAESIRLPRRVQVEMALEILESQGRLYETSIGYYNLGVHDPFTYSIVP